MNRLGTVVKAELGAEGRPVAPPAPAVVPVVPLELPLELVPVCAGVETLVVELVPVVWAEPVEVDEPEVLEADDDDVLLALLLSSLSPSFLTMMLL